MKEITLTQGKVALVDDEDYERLMQYNWHYAKKRESSKNVGRRVWVPEIYKFKIIPLACEVLQLEVMIDHISGNELDNQRHNLRLCTYAQNRQNSRKTKRKTSSKYKGIYLLFNKRWHAKIGLVDIWNQAFSKNLGCFTSEEKAAKAYDKAARFYFGAFACLNFPLVGERSAI